MDEGFIIILYIRINSKGALDFLKSGHDAYEYFKGNIIGECIMMEVNPTGFSMSELHNKR
jgi:hypothetical protein